MKMKNLVCEKLRVFKYKGNFRNNNDSTLWYYNKILAKGNLNSDYVNHFENKILLYSKILRKKFVHVHLPRIWTFQGIILHWKRRNSNR